VDEKIEKLWKDVKARSIYGPILDKVNNEKSRGSFAQHPLAIENQSKNGQLEVYKGANTNGTPAGSSQTSAPGNQLAGAPGTDKNSQVFCLFTNPSTISVQYL
jgi:hypothetical protein